MTTYGKESGPTVALATEGTHGRDVMTSHRKILLILISLTVMVIAVVPSCAFAGPLLGGYGGPGDGNQAILGSALLGGGGSSGGGAGSTGSSSGAAAGTAGGQSGREQSSGSATASSGLSSTAGGRPKGAARGGGGSSRDNTTESPGSVARAYPVSSSRPIPEATETLGLSGTDLAYIFLTLCALVLTGVLTRRLARSSDRQGTQWLKVEHPESE
jgi:hypothetical protein